MLCSTCIFALASMVPLQLAVAAPGPDRNTSRIVQDFYTDVVYPARNDYLVANLYRRDGAQRALELSHFVGAEDQGERPGSVDLCQTFRTFVPGCGTGNQIVVLL